jgi:transposase
LYRLEQVLERNGFGFDRGTMSRWLEQLGAVFGATVIEAARTHAFCDCVLHHDRRDRFCDPARPKGGRPRRPCRKGHYFVQLADRDYIFFEYTPKETSASVRAMFQGFSGYLQLDAKSVYDVLFRPPDVDDPDNDGCTRHEVGCWSHARRKHWEAVLNCAHHLWLHAALRWSSATVDCVWTTISARWSSAGK